MSELAIHNSQLKIHNLLIPKTSENITFSLVVWHIAE